MTANPYEPPEGEYKRPGTSRHGCAAGILAVAIIAGTIIFSPADPISMLIVGPVVAAAVVGAYLLGVWNGRRD